MVFFSFLKIQYKKVEKKNKHDVSGSISVEKPKPVAFLCCKLNFYFHIHLWFLQALKQDNKRICSNVQLVSHFNFSQSNVALDVNTNCSNWPVYLPVFVICLPVRWKGYTQKPILCLQVVIRSESTESFRPDHVKLMLSVHLIKAQHALIHMLLSHWLK